MSAEMVLKMKKNLTLYNVIFPIWFLIIFPLTWIVILPANFIIDSTIFLITLSLLKIKNKTVIYKKAIIKIWLFGFISDIIGTAFMFLYYGSTDRAMTIWLNSVFFNTIYCAVFGNFQIMFDVYII